jgi:hypothetical protein
MGTLLIGYDLNKNDSDYFELIDAIKTMGAWWHHLDSTWLVKTDLNAVAIRDALRPHLDANDELLVVDVTDDARAWCGFSEKGSKWLKETF